MTGSGLGVGRLARTGRALLASVSVGLALVALGPAIGAAAPGRPAGPIAADDVAAFPPTRPTRVLAIGDSVLLGAASQLTADLPGREVVVDAEVSRSTGTAAAVARTYDTDWDVVVLFVGHNDGASPGVYQPPYRSMLDRFALVARVVVVTVHEVRPYYPGVNAFLRAEAAARPNVRIADWNAAAGPGTTASDGLHLTAAGRVALARLLADQVGWAELEFLPTTTTAPPTTLPSTTTAAPSTTTEVAVSLAPAVSIDRQPPSTTAPNSTTDLTGREDRSGEQVATRSSDAFASDRSAPWTTPWGIWVAFALGAVVMAVVLVRELGPAPSAGERSSQR